MQLPGRVPVRSHILWRGRHWERVTTKQMKKKTAWRATVPRQSRRKVFVTAGRSVLLFFIGGWWVLTKSEVGEEDGRLDAENVDVVQHLDGEGGLSCQ